jgi:glutamate racemase
MQQDVGVIVVACNTASSTALRELESELPVPVIGTVEPAARTALKVTRSGTIGVLGTNATVASSVYENALKRLEPSLRVVSQACPLFVPLVEAGMFDGEIVDKIVELYLAPLKSQGVDTVILGCTHYPLLLTPIQRYLGDSVAVVECSKAMLQDVINVLGSSDAAQREAAGGTSYFVTDAVGQFNQLASLFLGYEGVRASKVELAPSSPAETTHLRVASS